VGRQELVQRKKKKAPATAAFIHKRRGFAAAWLTNYGDYRDKYIQDNSYLPPPKGIWRHLPVAPEPRAPSGQIQVGASAQSPLFPSPAGTQPDRLGVHACCHASSGQVRPAPA
jgi:hypothetical protein